MIGLASAGAELDWSIYVARIQAIEPSIKVILVSLDEDPALIQGEREQSRLIRPETPQPADCLYATTGARARCLPVSPLDRRKARQPTSTTKG